MKTSDLKDDFGLANLPLRTYRFVSFAVSTLVMTAIGGLAIWLRAEPALVVAIMTPIATLSATYTAAGAWHDKSVRQSIVKEEVAFAHSQDLQPIKDGGPPPMRRTT